MKKILTILGARPQFVKAAVLSRIIAKHREIEEVIIHTGQHYDKNMSQIFFEEMQIPSPKYNLNINALDHGAMTGQMLTGIDAIIHIEKPDMVLVYGDTNSTLAGALAAAKHPCKLVHIEGGLRSHHWGMPEEINRVITDALADVIFCPTTASVTNLEKEGLTRQKKEIIISGDIMKDAVLFYKSIAKEKSTILSGISNGDKPIVLVTIHRQENTKDKKTLATIFNAFDQLNHHYHLVLPLHPRTKKCMDLYGIKTAIKLVEPLGYFDMLTLIQASYMVITDSGGLQKEAYFNEKPCVIVRDQTEWIELVNGGYAQLTGANSTQILEAVDQLKHTQLDYSNNLYGEDVGEKIYKSIIKYTR